MTIGEAFKQLSLVLHAVYDRREANNIAGLVIEHITGFRGSERIVNKQNILTQSQENFFVQATSDLLIRKPVQYVLNEVYFYSLKLYVNEQVLIPRPETEELVAWVIDDAKHCLNETTCIMLDVGTGSGCIAIAIKKNLPAIDMYAFDVSVKALEVAKKNAERQQTEIEFSEINILDEEQWKTLPELDYIISNPPYIAQSETFSISDNVLKYEPHVALFVPDDSPLLFHEAISRFGLKYLKKDGKLFFEINELFGNEVVKLLTEKGYKNIELRKDLQGKDRMIKAEK